MRFPESLANWTEKAGQFAARHADVVGAAAPGLLILAAPVLVAGPLLGVVGFGAAGISAGSAAAVAQSAAMGGYGVAAVHGVIQGVGGLGAAVGGYVASQKGKGGEGGEGGKGGKDDEGGKDDGVKTVRMAGQGRRGNKG